MPTAKNVKTTFVRAVIRRTSPHPIQYIMSQIVAIPVEEELKKNPELKKSDIKYLKEWLKKQPHLPNISDSSLVLFLHSNYYRMEPTKATIENYYTIRTHVPEIFANRDPLASKDVRQGFSYLTILPLKQLTNEGYNMLFAKLIDPDPAKFDFFQFGKACYMNLDLWTYLSGPTKGHIVVLDVKEVTFGHATRISPLAMKKFMSYMQEGMPVRLKGLHYFNVTPGMEAILKIMKPFLKKELVEILYIHKTIESVEKFMPIESFPNEVGGKAGPLLKLHEAQIKELEKYRDWFIQEESQSQVDETKRMGKAKSASELFGTAGSFKKIDID